ncbi:MAG: hypothetical protein JXB10_09335 [Pirellulales bacterium]|nr:hypothetical protein [Pirellulales bacterium]
MSQVPHPSIIDLPPADFFERRQPDAADGPPGVERRQFVNSHSDLSPEAADLAQAIDQYKISHRRRFITYEEMLMVLKSLGYHR